MHSLSLNRYQKQKRLTTFLHHFQCLTLCWSTSTQLVFCFSQILFADFRTLYLFVLFLTRLREIKKMYSSTFRFLVYQQDPKHKSQTGLLLETWCSNGWRLPVRNSTPVNSSFSLLSAAQYAHTVDIHSAESSQWKINLLLTLTHDAVEVQAPPFSGSLPGLAFLSSFLRTWWDQRHYLSPQKCHRCTNLTNVSLSLHPLPLYCSLEYM